MDKYTNKNVSTAANDLHCKLVGVGPVSPAWDSNYKGIDDYPLS